MMTQEELAQIHHEAEIEFMKYPGVLGVGFGVKEKQGQLTEQVALRVYVVEKKDVSELLPGHVIPKEFKGIPTDVIKVPVGQKHSCEDTSQYSPIIGGIQVTNKKPRATDSTLIDVGTLGFFSTIDGNTDTEKNVVLVSNNHVLGANGGGSGDTIYQPSGSRSVASINDVGVQEHHSFQYQGDPSASDFWIDVATARVAICISSWCNSNCGTSFKNEIHGLNVNGGDAIADVNRVNQSDIANNAIYTVVKVGRTTGRTVGRVTDVGGTAIIDGVTNNNIIIIEATENNCNGVMEFSDHGDSGSAIINSDAKIVGMLYAGNGAQTFACHIHPILDRMGITPITTANPHPVGETRADAPGTIIDSQTDHVAELRARLLETDEGKEIFTLVERHRGEVVELVNHKRPVTVAWHRNKGPVFLSHAMNSARNPDYLIPFEIEGITRDQLIRNLSQALAAHGSPELNELIMRHFDDCLRQINTFDNLHELVAHFPEFVTQTVSLRAGQADPVIANSTVCPRD